MADSSISKQFLEDSFGLDLSRIAGVLEDLAAYKPAHTDLTDLSVEESIDKLLAANIKSQTFIDASSDVLKEEREIRSGINSLNFKAKQTSKEAITSWHTEVRTTLNIDTNIRRVSESFGNR